MIFIKARRPTCSQSADYVIENGAEVITGKKNVPKSKRSRKPGSIITLPACLPACQPASQPARPNPACLPTLIFSSYVGSGPASTVHPQKYRVCSLLPCGHLLGKGSPLGSCRLCLFYFCFFPMWYPGSGVGLDCIVS